MYFDAAHLVRAGDHLGLLFGADVVGADEGALVIGVEGILHPDGHAGQFEGLAGLGVDGFHAHVGELIGHVEVGVAHGVHMLGADDVGIARAEVKLLVNDGLFRLEDDRDLGEGDLRVAAIELAHDALGTLGVTGGKADGLGGVDTLEGIGDPLVDRELAAVAPTTEVDEGSIVAFAVEDVRRVERAVQFPDGGEDLPRSE